MNRISKLIAATTIAIFAVGMVSAPAHAVAHSSSITFNASPEPVTSGKKVTLSGKAGFGNKDNAAKVHFYFKSKSSSTYKYISTTLASPMGTYSKNLKQTVSGNWKAVYAGNSKRETVTSRVDYVRARKYVSYEKTVASDYGNEIIDLTWGFYHTTGRVRVHYDVYCTDTSYNFVSIDYHGSNSKAGPWRDFDGYSYSGTWNFTPGDTYGWLTVAVQNDCDWTVSITQYAGKHWVTV